LKIRLKTKNKKEGRQDKKKQKTMKALKIEYKKKTLKIKDIKENRLKTNKL
jgi:hypothetical protein